MELQGKKYLLAYKSENIAPSPGEKRNWKYSGHTKKSLRRELIQDTFPKDKICFGLCAVKFICEEIPNADFHSWVFWGIGNWNSWVVFFLGRKILDILFCPSQMLGVPLELGSPFWVLFAGKSPRGNWGLEQELPWMSQEFWVWSQDIVMFELFITICVKICSFI